jgi:hypothetical protein
MRAAGLLLALLLLSCSTQPDVDPLEAKAQAGDPVAACQFAARELHNCALEKRRWEQGESSERPACIADGVGEKANSYLDNVKFGRQGADYVMFMLEKTSIHVIAIGLAISPADKVIKNTEVQRADCAELADFLK